MKKKKNLWAKPALLFAASAVLLLASTVGSTRAALEYTSDAYAVQFNVPSIGVSLLENGEVVSSRDYEGDDWVGTGEEGKLLEGRFGEDEKLVPGRVYDEELSVQNSGEIDSYVRVILTRSWKDAQGKDTTLSPELIGLGLEESGWIEDTASEGSKERIILYGRYPLAAGESRTFCRTLKLDPSIMTDIREERTPVSGGTQVTTTYRYNGYSFDLAAEVNAVQTHNAEDAIRSAWGVDVSIAEDGSLSLP
ncbi:MAG: hypothetical protein K2N46_10700 [Lachnospiraceae bacterium]|nr:hypothetical protein [Lachnospiraceae bacterium]